MAEWLNAAVSKTVLPVIQVTRVRIPLPPPENLKRSERNAFNFPGGRGIRTDEVETRKKRASGTFLAFRPTEPAREGSAFAARA